MAHLTHHDILHLAAPLIRHGLAVDLHACDREKRRIAFRASESSDEFPTPLHVTHSLLDDPKQGLEITRAIRHPSGIIATLRARGADAARLIEAMDDVPLEAQIVVEGDTLCARSLSLTLRGTAAEPSAHVELEHVSALIGTLEVSFDISTGAGMPADVLLLRAGTEPAYRRDHLANGRLRPSLDPTSRQLASQVAGSPQARAGESLDISRLPDDLLAVLGQYFRPLAWRSDHWRTVLRQLGHEPGRSSRADRHVREAILHLQSVLGQAPEHYHRRFHKQRWRVYLRRLKPALLLAGILASMPIIYLLVDRGGLEMHPLVLGITPLLMVATVALTAREIPVMELPAPPHPLRTPAWPTLRHKTPAPAYAPASVQAQSPDP